MRFQNWTPSDQAAENHTRVKPPHTIDGGSRVPQPIPASSAADHPQRRQSSSTTSVADDLRAARRRRPPSRASPTASDHDVRDLVWRKFSTHHPRPTNLSDERRQRPTSRASPTASDHDVRDLVWRKTFTRHPQPVPASSSILYRKGQSSTISIP